jgi:hypothetical protein
MSTLTRKRPERVGKAAALLAPPTATGPDLPDKPEYRLYYDALHERE